MGSARGHRRRRWCRLRRGAGRRYGSRSAHRRGGRRRSWCRRWCSHYAAALSTTKEMDMRTYFALAAILLTVTACGDTWGQRAVTGGGIGAGSGALIGAVTPLGVLPGALIGGAVGAG